MCVCERERERFSAQTLVIIEEPLVRSESQKLIGGDSEKHNFKSEQKFFRKKPNTVYERGAKFYLYL